MYQNEGPQLLKWVCWWNPDKSGGWVRKAGVWDVWVTGLRKRGNSSHLQWCPRWVSFGIMTLSTSDRPMGEAFTGSLSRAWKDSRRQQTEASAFRWVYLSFAPLPSASLLFSAICKASSDNHLTFCIFFSWGWSWSLPPVQCHNCPSTVL